MNNIEISKNSPKRRQDLRNILLLVALASILFFFRLGERGLADPEEGRYGEIAREMAENGDLITPRLNYIKRFHKPPLVFWETVTAIRIFGLGDVQDKFPAFIAKPFKLLFSGANDSIDEFVLRLTPACAALLTVVGIYLLGSYLFNRSIGFMAGLVLITAPQFYALGQILNTDMALACLTTFSFLFFVLAADSGTDRRRTWSLLFFLTLALGVLAKGLVIFITALIPILMYSIIPGNRDCLRRIWSLPELILFLVVSLPWYIIVCIQNEGLLHYLLFEQSFSRAYTTTFRKAQPIWFFIPVIAVGFFPWTVFAVYCVIKHHTFRIKNLTRDQNYLLLLFFWFAAPFILFSIFPSKLMTYTLPLIPPLAIFVAYGFHHLLKIDAHYCKRFSRCFIAFGLAIVTILLGIVAIYFGFKFLPEYDFSFQYIIIIAALIFNCGLLSMIAYVYRKRHLMFWTIFTCFFALLVTVKFLAAEIDQRLNWRVRGKRLSEQIIAAGGKDDTVIMHGRFLPSVPFYMQKRIVTVDIETETPFEKDRKILDRYLYLGIDNLQKLIGANQRMFCIIKKSYLEKLEPETFFTIGEIDNLVLISNRPAQ